MKKTSFVENSGLAGRLKDLRAEKNLSPAGLAKLADVTPASVWQWEHNGTLPRPKTLATVAEQLGVTPEFLLHGRRKSDRPGTLIASGSNAAVISREASLEDLIRAIEAKGFEVTVRSKGGA